MSNTHTNRRLYEVAKAYSQAAVSEVFAESDLICIRSKDDTPYYVSVVSNAFAAYKGEAGLTGYFSLAFLDDESPFFEAMEVEQAQECLLAIFSDERSELEKSDLEAIDASGVPFTGDYPQFRFKEQYRYPWFISEGDEEDLILIMEALIFAKGYFASHGKRSTSDSFSSWLDAMGVSEGEGREYLPAVSWRGEGFEVTPLILQDEAYGYVFPQAYFTDEERQLHFKRMKAKAGKILYYITGIIPEPIMGQKDERPLYPAFCITYDPQSDQILDFAMVEDYEAEHATFVASLLKLFEERGKVQAIHCFGKRSLPLLEKIGPQMGVMVVDGGKNSIVDELIVSMFDELFTPHEHEHGPHCDHDHE